MKKTRNFNKIYLDGKKVVYEKKNCFLCADNDYWWGRNSVGQYC